MLLANKAKLMATTMMTINLCRVLIECNLNMGRILSIFIILLVPFRRVVYSINLINLDDLIIDNIHMIVISTIKTLDLKMSSQIEILDVLLFNDARQTHD